MATCENKKVDGKLEVANQKSDYLDKLKFQGTANLNEAVQIIQNQTVADLKGNLLPQQYNSSISDKAFALGKRMMVLDKSIYGPSLQTIKNQKVLSSDTLDNFRLNSLKYWTIDETRQNITYLKEPAKHQITSYNYFHRLTKDNKPKDPNATQQWIIISPDRAKFFDAVVPKSVASKLPAGIAAYQKANSGVVVVDDNASAISANSVNVPQGMAVAYNPQLWKLYVNGGVSSDGFVYPSLLKTNVEYFDHAFELNVPFFHEEINESALFVKPLIYDVNFDYNFFVKEYEKNIVTVSERDLPNFYILESEMELEGSNPEYAKMITLGGVMNIKDVTLSQPKEGTNARGNSKNFFASYGLNVKTARQAQQEKNAVHEGLQYVNDKHFNLIVPFDNIQILNKFYGQKNMFPMSVDLSFSTDRTTSISTILNDCRLDKTFIKDVIFGTHEKFQDFVEDLETTVQTKNDQGGSTLNKGSNASFNSRRTWNITDWLIDVSKRLDVPVLTNGTILFNQTSTAQDNVTGIMRNLLQMIFTGKLKKLIKDKSRTYEDVLNGKLAYSETMMYRIEKRLADEQGNPVGDPIQNYYVANSNLIDTLKLIDIQVKYNTRYRYDVFAFQLVIGNKYKYNNIGLDDNNAVIEVESSPSVLVVEVPYFSHANIILDDPPVRPDVDIVSYKDIDNELLLRFNGNVGQYYEMPIIIDVEDRRKVEEYRQIKKIASDKPFRFSSDDHASIFQIYRTEEEPKDYSSFAGKLRIAVQTDVSPLTAQSATSAAYKDKIKPNRKYWYTFRSVDNHGHLSQPSNVFQVEMVNNHGTVYPIIEDYEFKKVQNKKVSKPMRRYVYIAPTMIQSLIDEEKSNMIGIESAKDIDVSKVTLGLEDQGVWNKRYKIRITSKKTGKKIDINVMPTYKGVRKEKKED